ncbi:hypothetical protein MMC31_004483 [Peltigera leucophlebia]|nr:hypothetical protein [Peltigera leucophlebia]
MSDIEDDADNGATNPEAGEVLVQSSMESDSSLETSNSELSNSACTRKRKKSQRHRHVPESRMMRLRPLYSNEYRKVFNDTITGIVQGTPVGDHDLLSPKQIGITCWSSEELGAFFTALARNGRHNLPAISSAIGTKTEPEVHVYLQLLQNATIHQHVNGPRDELFQNSDVPAALEIGQDCCAALEITADALSVLQQEEENKLERKKHGRLWRLDRRIADRIEQPRAHKEDGHVDHHRDVPAAELLNLNCFLELSKNVFMNSTTEEDNWRSYCGEKIPVSIMYSAFSDIHALAVSITKRLISTSLFIAMSRLRHTRKRVGHNVHSKDIKAALDILGMKHNSREFWTRVARRCRLTVFGGNKSRSGPKLSYDEVERRLSATWGKKQRKSARQLNRNDDGQSGSEGTGENEAIAGSEESALSTGLNSDDQAASDIENTSKENTHTPSDADSDSLFSSADGSILALSEEGQVSDSEDMTEDEQQGIDPDLYAEALDSRASQSEEQSIWKMLGREPPANVILMPEKVAIPRPIQPQRRSGNDLDDWRAWTDFAPEWETYKNPIFDKTRGKKRVAVETPSSWHNSTEVDSNQSQGVNGDEDSEESGHLDE